MGWEEDSGIELGDGVGVGAYVAGDGLASRERAHGGDLKCPYAFGGESIERELTELTLGECLYGRGKAKDEARTNGVDTCGWEDEGVIDLGGIELVGSGDDRHIGRGDRGERVVGSERIGKGAEEGGLRDGTVEERVLLHWEDGFVERSVGVAARVGGVVLHLESVGTVVGVEKGECGEEEWANLGRERGAVEREDGAVGKLGLDIDNEGYDVDNAALVGRDKGGGREAFEEFLIDTCHIEATVVGEERGDAMAVLVESREERIVGFVVVGHGLLCGEGLQEVRLDRHFGESIGGDTVGREVEGVKEEERGYGGDFVKILFVGEHREIETDVEGGRKHLGRDTLLDGGVVVTAGREATLEELIIGVVEIMVERSGGLDVAVGDFASDGEGDEDIDRLHNIYPVGA